MHYRARFHKLSRKIDYALLSVFVGQQSLIMQELEDETPDETKLIANNPQQSFVSLAANRIRLQGGKVILSNSFIKKTQGRPMLYPTLSRRFNGPIFNADNSKKINSNASVYLITKLKTALTFYLTALYFLQLVMLWTIKQVHQGRAECVVLGYRCWRHHVLRY